MNLPKPEELGIQSYDAIRDGLQTRVRPEKWHIVKTMLANLSVALFTAHNEADLTNDEVYFLTDMLPKVLDDYLYNMPNKEKQNPEAYKEASDKADMVISELGV